MKVRNVMVIGLLVREAFSFWTGHPFDFELWVRTGYWVAHGVSPYGVLQSAPGLSFADIYNRLGESTVGYLPFWPLLLAGIYKLYLIVGFGNRFVYYFLIKQPLIIGDLLLGYAIFSYVRTKRPEASPYLLSLWVLSPFTIIVSSVWGMFDSLAMLFVVSALAARWGTTRAAQEGIAIWIKSIPLVYAIPFALSTKKWLRNVIIAIGIPAVGSVATILALGWPIDTAFATLASTVTKGGQSLSVLGASFYTQTLNYPSWPESVLSVLAYVWIPAVIVATALAYRWFGFTTERGLVQSLLLCTIAFMLFKAQVNEQYAIYLLALALVDIGIWNPRRRWLYLAITGVIMVYLAVNNPELARFASPAFPQALSVDGNLVVAWGNARFVVLFACSIVFAALNAAYAILLFRDRRTPAKQPTRTVA